MVDVCCLVVEIGTSREGVVCVNHREDGLDWWCVPPPIIVDGHAVAVLVCATM